MYIRSFNFEELLTQKNSYKQMLFCLFLREFYMDSGSLLLVFRFGLAGNHPRATRFSCSKISPMVQNDENEKTPKSDDQKTSLTTIEAAIPTIPRSRKHHQQRVPK